VTLRRVALAAFAAWIALVVLINYVTPLRHQTVIWQVAAAEHVDPMLVAAVIRTESGFRADVVSHRGAVGLMQVLPETATWIRAQTGVKGPLTQPTANIRLGTWYLAYLLRMYHGHLTLALAAYNSGPRIVNSWLQGGVLTVRSPPAAIPYAETRAFVSRVMWLRRAYGVVYAGLKSGRG
jgi:soluble lytic murein transglycosylase